MEKQLACVWCSGTSKPTVTAEESDYGKVKVRRCPDCKGILAAYLIEAETCLQEVKQFKD